MTTSHRLVSTGAGPELLRAEEAAGLLGLGRSKTYQLIAASAIPVVRIGRSVRVPRTALLRWIEEQTEPHQNPAQRIASGPLR